MFKQVVSFSLAGVLTVESFSVAAGHKNAHDTLSQRCPAIQVSVPSEHRQEHLPEERNLGFVFNEAMPVATGVNDFGW
jgi:hypothetical protein